MMDAGYFHVSAVVNNTAVDMGVQISLQYSGLVSFGCIPRSGIAGPCRCSLEGHMVASCQHLLSWLFDDSHSNRHEVMSHCAFDLQFPYD